MFPSLHKRPLGWRGHSLPTYRCSCSAAAGRMPEPHKGVRNGAIQSTKIQNLHGARKSMSRRQPPLWSKYWTYRQGPQAGSQAQTRVTARQAAHQKPVWGKQRKLYDASLPPAQRMPGPTGLNLLQLLERRLDNVVYRLGFARTPPMSRQVVGHGRVL